MSLPKYLAIPVFTEIGSRRIPDRDVLSIREQGKTHTIRKVCAMFPHVSEGHVRRILNNTMRPDVKDI